MTNTTVLDLYKSMKKQSGDDLSALKSAFSSKFTKGQFDFGDVVQTVNQASKNETFFANFKARLEKSFPEAKKLKFFSDKEMEALSLKFANNEHTVRDIADKTQLGDAMQTNIIAVIGSLLYESDLLSKVDRIDSSNSYKIIEKETKLARVDPTNEIGAGTKRKIVNRASEKLDPMNKMSILVEASEAAENASDLAYLLTIIIEDLVFATRDSVEYQILNGDDTGENFRGLNVITGTGATEKGPIVVDTTGALNTYDALWLLWKGRNRQNKRRMGPDQFIMTEATKDAIVSSKLTDANYLTWIRDIITGENFITLPDGKKVEVVLVDDDKMDLGEVILGPLKAYKLVVSNGFEVSNDMGLTNFENDIVTYKCKFLGDGGYQKSFTKKVDGTTPNLKENVWRKATNIII